ncbi:MAG TPA: tRNA (cytidine(34)-2'-O)-methyltransferase [Rhizomicrobium sp.]|jgi:tRNA (cytidine/uridine-2'-O-)-methyltransferase
MRLALFEPDIPQNAGTLIRAGACFGVPVDLIEPCGFLLGDAHFRRAGMDYLDRANVVRHHSWQTFLAQRSGRLVLLTTQAQSSYLDFMFDPSDTILLGRESSGAPAAVHSAATARLRIPMRAGLRSLNVAMAGAIVLSEALRQTGGFPE